MKTTSIVIAFFVQFVPLLAIPFSFKLAGGLIGRINQFLGGYGSKLGQFVKGNPNDPFSFQNKAKRKAVEGMTRRQHAVTEAGLSGEANQPGKPGYQGGARARLRRARARFAATVGGNIEERMARYNKEGKERQDLLSGYWDDSLVYAGGGYEAKNGETYWDEKKNDGRGGVSVNDTGGSIFIDSKGRKISEGLYRQGKSKYGDSVHSLGQSYEYALRKAQNDNHKGAFEFAFSRNVEQRQGWGQSEIDAMYPAAAYPHKGKLMSQWYSRPKYNAQTGQVEWHSVEDNTADGRDAYTNMTQDMHRNLQGYMESGQQDHVIRVMSQRQEQFEQALDTNAYTDTVDASGNVTKTAAQNRQRDLDDLARTYELIDNVSNEYGMGGATPGTPEASGVPLTGSEKVVASGTSAAVPYVVAAKKNRKYEMSEMDAATGQRTLYTRPTYKTVTDPSTGDQRTVIDQAAREIGRGVPGDTGYSRIAPER